jgi:hypothetical protein
VNNIKKAIIAFALIAVMILAVTIPVGLTSANTGDGTGTLSIYKGLGTKANYSSVTGGYSYESSLADKHSEYEHNLDALLDGKGNWFQYNDFDYESGETYTFDLVTGHNLKKVGEYTISYDPDSKEFTIVLYPNNLLVASGVKFSISNDYVLGAKNANDSKVKGNPANPIWTSSPGQQQFPSKDLKVNGNEYTFKAGWADVSKTIYVYMHLSLDGYEYTGSATSGDSFEFEIVNTATEKKYTMNVPMNGGDKLNLPAGTYTITELAEGWIPSFEVNGVAVIGTEITVEIKAGKVTNVKVVNEEDGIGEFAGSKFGMMLFMLDIEVLKTTKYDAMGSITTGGIRGAGDNNWFSWTQLPVAAIVNDGLVFVGDLINGDKLTKIGEFTVYADADGNLVIVLFSNDKKANINAATQIAFGNANKGKTNSDVSGSNSNNGSGLYYMAANSLGKVNNTIVISAADVAKVTDDKEFQYFFVHTGIGTQTTVNDVSVNYADVEFTVVVKDADGEIVDSFALKDGEFYMTDSLKAGMYTIEITGPNGWKLTYDGLVEVIGGEGSFVEVFAELALSFKVGPGNAAV